MGGFRFRVPDSLAGERLDRIVASSVEGLSRTLARRLIEQGRVHVEGRSVEPDSRPPLGAQVEGSLPPPVASELIAEPFTLDVLYEDAHLLVIDKPSGLSVHPGAGRRSATLVNQLLGSGRNLSRVGAPERPGIVHRLDRETSGCLVVALSDVAHHALAAQFQRRRVDKEYRALVRGVLARPHGRVELPIGRHPVQRTRMSVQSRTGRAALTEYRVLDSGRGMSWLAIDLRTGRTHQIRVHLTSLGHPIIGDSVYGRPRRRICAEPLRGIGPPGRLMLHAYRVAFQHPLGSHRIEVRSPLPPDMVHYLTLSGLHD
ncbi:MAG: RluA family pseudouridine synthase [Acidobacteriota bacterium]